MTSRPARHGISGAPGGLAAQKLSRMPCPPLTSIAWDFLPCAAHPVLNPTEPPCTDPYARWCDRESERSPTYVNSITRILTKQTVAERSGLGPVAMRCATKRSKRSACGPSGVSNELQRHHQDCASAPRESSPPE